MMIDFPISHQDTPGVEADNSERGTEKAYLEAAHVNNAASVTRTTVNSKKRGVKHLVRHGIIKSVISLGMPEKESKTDWFVAAYIRPLFLRKAADRSVGPILFIDPADLARLDDTWHLKSLQG